MRTTVVTSARSSIAAWAGRAGRGLARRAVDAWLDRWADAKLAWRRLANRAPGSPADPPRILVVDELLPDPRAGAGYPRAAELVRAIVAAGWDVTLYPMIGSGEPHPPDIPALADVPVRFVPSRGPRGLRRLLRGTVDPFDVVLISRPENMAIFSSIRAAMRIDATVVYDAEAVFALRERTRRRLFDDGAGEPGPDLEAEIALTAGADALITVTEAEARLFRERTAADVHVVSHAIPVRADTGGFDGRSDFLFVGRSTGPRDRSPNVDSLVWFVRDVMPRLDAAMGAGYRLVVAGLADAELVASLGSDRVVFLGVVDDLGTVYDRCRVFVAPTRFAAGIPLKVVEAAAAGIPCVVTSLLAGQLGFDDGRALIAAADAEAFAAGCVRLYRDRDLWTRVRDAARARVAVDYSRETFGAAVRAVLDAAASRGR